MEALLCLTATIPIRDVQFYAFEFGASLSFKEVEFLQIGEISGYGKPIQNTHISRMNIHLPAILGFQMPGFWLAIFTRLFGGFLRHALRYHPNRADNPLGH